VRFTSVDIVRRDLVAKIVEAYDRGGTSDRAGTRRP
jgi:phosphate starvation-inducible protein PhoH